MSVTEVPTELIMTINVEELVRVRKPGQRPYLTKGLAEERAWMRADAWRWVAQGLGDATGLDKPKAKELASALLETVSQPLQRVGVGELKDLVPGLEALQPDVTPTPVVTPTPSEDTSQKKGLNKKEKVSRVVEGNENICGVMYRDL